MNLNLALTLTLRQVIMNLFGIPLNLLVISVFLSIKRLGVSGALPRYHVRVRVRSGLGVSGALRVATGDPNPDPNPNPTPIPNPNPGALRVATGSLGLATTAAAALVYLTRDAAAKTE